MKLRKQDWGSWQRTIFKKDVYWTMLSDRNGSDRWVWSGFRNQEALAVILGVTYGIASLQPGSQVLLMICCSLEPHPSKHFHCLQMIARLECILFSGNFFGFRRENCKTLINPSTRIDAHTIPKTYPLMSGITGYMQRKCNLWFMP